MDPLQQQQTPPPAPPLPPEENEFTHDHRGHITPLRTFSSDLANAVREKGGSVVRIAIAEEEKHRRQYQEASITSRRNIVFVIIGFILVTASIIAIVWAYAHHKASNTVDIPAPTNVSTSLISTETAKTIDLSGIQSSDTLVEDIQAVVADTSMQTATMKNITLAKTLGGVQTNLPVDQFLSGLESHAPIDFVHGLLGDYMLGIYDYEGQNNLFFIIHGTAHDYLLAGMLAWEPRLFNDMVPLFNIDTSSFTKADLQSPPFVDTIIENHDTRAVLDEKKKVLLFYTFLDQNTLLIATDPKTLTEVVRRYQ